MISYCERVASLPQTNWLSELLVPLGDVRTTSTNIECKTTTTTNAAWSMQTQTHGLSSTAAALETSAHPLADCPRAVSLEKTGTDCRRAGLSSRPNYSYTALVGMALNQSKCNSLPVSDIYAFIENKFPYFKNATKSEKCSWKNSVRHSLSRDHYFRKVEQQGTTACTSMKGRKGFHWEIIPEKRAALENELLKYDGVVKRNVTNQQLASSVPSSSEEGILLVNHTTAATATHVSPLAAFKTQHWNLMNGDAAMSVMTFSKDPRFNHRKSALPSLPQLPGVKALSMEPEVFLFPKPGTYLAVDAPGAEYTIPLVEPYLGCTQLRPPMKLQPPPVISGKHQKCKKHSCVKGDLNVTKHGDPVPSADVETEMKRQQSSDSSSDSVFFSPQTLVGPCTPSGDPPSPDNNSFDELPLAEDLDISVRTDTCGNTDEELLKKIPVDILEKYGLDLEFVQKNLPAAQQLLDSGVFYKNAMATPSLFDCNSPTATCLTTVKDGAFQAFKLQPMALSPLTPIITPQFKNSDAPHATGDRLEPFQDQKHESHGTKLSCMPPNDNGVSDDELARVLDHLDNNSLKELHQLEIEFNSCWLSSKSTSNSPPIQSAALSNNPGPISTASGQQQIPTLVSPVPIRDPTLPPANTERESSLDEFLKILPQGENNVVNAFLQQSSRKRLHEDNSIEPQDVAPSPEPKRTKNDPTESPSPTSSGSDLMSTAQTSTPQYLNTCASVHISPEFATNFIIIEEPPFNCSLAPLVQEMVC